MRLLVEFGFVRRIHLQAIVSNAAALRSYEKAASWSRCAGVSTNGSAGDTRTFCWWRSYDPDTTRPTRDSIQLTPAKRRSRI